MARMGHQVLGIDIADEMIRLARAKAAAANLSITFEIANAFAPQIPGTRFDVILSRHLLWAAPSPASTLQQWATRLRPGGRLILVEGYWSAGGGLHLADVINALPSGLPPLHTENLSLQERLWGNPVTDERYLVIADQRL